MRALRALSSPGWSERFLFLDLICRYACTCVNILLQELVSTPRDCVCWTGNAAAHAVLHGFIAVGTAVVNAIGIAIIGIAPRGLAAARASAARKWRGAPCAAFVNSVFGFVLLSAQTCTSSHVPSSCVFPPASTYSVSSDCQDTDDHWSGDIELVRDGIDGGHFACAVAEDAQHWVQFFFNHPIKINGFQKLLFNDDGRQYKHQKVSLSTTGVFAGEEIVVFSCGSYAECGVSDGATVSFDSTEVRYVRFYSGRNSKNSYTHFIEVNVCMVVADEAAGCQEPSWLFEQGGNYYINLDASVNYGTFNSGHTCTSDADCTYEGCSQVSCSGYGSYSSCNNGVWDPYCRDGRCGYGRGVNYNWWCPEPPSLGVLTTNWPKVRLTQRPKVGDTEVEVDRSDYAYATTTGSRQPCRSTCWIDRMYWGSAGNCVQGNSLTGQHYGPFRLDLVGTPFRLKESIAPSISGDAPATGATPEPFGSIHCSSDLTSCAGAVGGYCGYGGLRGNGPLVLVVPGGLRCAPCPDGKYKADVWLDAPCVPCVAGKYKASASDECTDCVAGKYSSIEGRSSMCLHIFTCRYRQTEPMSVVCFAR